MTIWRLTYDHPYLGKCVSYHDSASAAIVRYNTDMCADDRCADPVYAKIRFTNAKQLIDALNRNGLTASSSNPRSSPHRRVSRS
jgi:pyocin large subunit-like protein